MASIYKIAEQAQRLLAGGTPSDDFEPRIQELCVVVSQVLAEEILNEHLAIKGIDGDTFIPGEYIVAFEDVPVLEDTNKKLWYSEIPATTLSLNYDMGVYQIGLMEDQNCVFIPMGNGDASLFTGNDIDNLEGRFGYWREDTRVYYHKVTGGNKFEKVLMKLITMGTGRDFEDQFEVAPNIQLKIVTKIVQLYQIEIQVPEDETNDMID